MTYGVLTFDTIQRDTDIILTSVDVENLHTGETYTFTGGIENILPALTTCKIDCIFILNAAEFYGFIDYYATIKNLPLYETLKDDTGQRKRITCESWAYRDGEGAQYNRKIWLYSCIGNTRHKRLHSVSFMNFSTVSGCYNLDDLIISLNLEFYGWRDRAEPLKAFAICVKEFNQLYLKLTGLPYLGKNNPACWTMGGAARNFYLKLRYPHATTSRLKLYHYSHPQNIKLEYYLRECKLLPPGLLYAREYEKIYTGNIKKYDVNSLFADRERILPELGKLIKSSWEEYINDNGEYEYIFVLDYALFKAKPGLPRVFSNPFKTYSTNDFEIEINEPWAVFAPYLKMIQRFYDVEDLNIVNVYRARKNVDLAIMEYVDILYREKANARARGEEGLATLVKYFLVNLHGKFAQKSISRNNKLAFDSITGLVVKEKGDTIIDEWDTKHFDYIRGAYIYSMARVRTMELILRFLETLPVAQTLEEHIFYSDTDSIVTDLNAPLDIVDPLELGKLKLEELYSAFEIIAPKTYWGRNIINNQIKLVCAGMDKNEVLKQVNETEGVNYELTNQTLHSIFTDHTKLYATKILTRIKGGNGYITQYRPLSAVDCADTDF